ncbi:MAG TPA: hypothetical protein VEH27_05885, partial [Methylomirabilota bacterium]|nr:hypothetical protein [Methylomirabilota bacterium]
QRFTRKGDSLGLHPDGAFALGLNAAQAKEIDEGTIGLFAAVKLLETQRLSPSSRHASTNFTGPKFPKGTKTSYWMPSLKPELEPLVENFTQSVNELLAPGQRALLSSWIQRLLEESTLGAFNDRGRIFTFTDEKWANGKLVSRFEVYDENGSHIWYCELWTPPLKFNPPPPAGFEFIFPFRHLFGDNGERRPFQ